MTMTVAIMRNKMYRLLRFRQKNDKYTHVFTAQCYNLRNEPPHQITGYQCPRFTIGVWMDLAGYGPAYV